MDETGLMEDLTREYLETKKEYGEKFEAEHLKNYVSAAYQEKS